MIIININQLLMKFINYYFLCFISIFFALSCNNRTENNNAKIIFEKYKNGNNKIVHLYFTDTANFTDDYYYQEFYENGNLKVQGIENQSVKKGEWIFYFENGNLKAKLIFDNNVLNGPIVLYNDKNVKTSYVAENGQIKRKNDDLLLFLIQNQSIFKERQNWNDSVNIVIDSIIKIL